MKSAKQLIKEAIEYKYSFDKFALENPEVNSELLAAGGLSCCETFDHQKVWFEGVFCPMCAIVDEMQNRDTE